MRTVVLIYLLCLLVGRTMAAPYLVLTVPWEAGAYAEAQCWSDHSQDTVFETANYSLDHPWVALDLSADKYTTLGPENTKGGWTAYVWAGYHMVADIPYTLTVQAFGPSQISGTKFDGSAAFQATLQTGEIRSWTLLATPATASQWRTKGYKLEVTPVPEPATFLVLASFFGFVRFSWRRVS